MKKFIKLIFLGMVFFSVVDATERDIELNSLFKKLKNSEIAEAQKIEKKIVEIWSTHPSNDRKGHRLTSLMAQGSFLLAKKELYKAHEIFSQIILADSNWAEAWNKRATVLYLMDQYQSSLNDIKITLTLEPRHFGALSGQARIFIKLREYEKAIESIERALRFHPSLSNRELIPEIERLIKEQSI